MEKQFIFDNNGICQNPNISHLLKWSEKMKWNMLEIETAEFGGSWFVGYSYNCYLGGGSHACSNKGASFDSEANAVIYGLEKVLSLLKSHYQKGTTLQLKKYISNALIELKGVQSQLF